MTESHWFDDIASPALLRAARRTYQSAIRAALVDAGCADVPRNGVFVLGAVARTGAPIGEIMRDLGVSGERAAELVDALVTRGYLDGAAEPVALTEKGARAAGAIRAAVDGIDRELMTRVGEQHVAATRATLGALVELRADHAD